VSRGWNQELCRRRHSWLYEMSKKSRAAWLRRQQYQLMSRSRNQDAQAAKGKKEERRTDDTSADRHTDSVRFTKTGAV